MSWSEFIDVDENLDRRSLERVCSHKILFDKIIQRNPDKIIEVGCGSGGMSYFLAKYLDCEVVAIDQERELVDKLKDLNDLDNLTYKEHDAFNLDKLQEDFDIAFHQGLMEHFDNEEILELTRVQFSVAEEVIFSVPSYYYPRKDFGNERLMRKNIWKEIFSSYDFSGHYYGKRLPHLFSSIKEWNPSQIKKYIIHGFNRPQLLIKLKRHNSKK